SDLLIALNEFGNTAFCTLKLPPLKPGSVMLEALYVMHCPAPAELQLFRYMPHSLIRILLDNTGKDLSAVLGIDQLAKLLQKVPRNNAQEVVRQARPLLSSMLYQAEQKAQPKQAGLVAAAQGQVRDQLNNGLERMKAHMQVNTTVRQSEIDYLQERPAASQHYLSQAQLRLDALRVIMIV